MSVDIRVVDDLLLDQQKTLSDPGLAQNTTFCVPSLYCIPDTIVMI